MEIRWLSSTAYRSKSELPWSPKMTTSSPLDLVSSQRKSSKLVGVSSEIRPETKESPSTALCLYDETWVWGNPRKKEIVMDQDPDAVTCCPRNISHLRTLLRKDREEEEHNGVSTELTLFLDPWEIKKQITAMDFGPLSLHGLNADIVKDHVIRYLHKDGIQRVAGETGLVVRVFDHDTSSTHKLVLKSRCQCGSFLLTNGWTKEFVRRRDLKRGDEVGFFWDRFDSKFHFRVLSHSPRDLQKQK